MTEAELDAAVVQRCDDLDLVTLHVREVRREGGEWPGFPDRMIFGPNQPYVLWRELKAGTGLSGAQKRWRWRLTTWSHQDYGVWTEKDLKSGRIAAELGALAGKDAQVDGQVDQADEDPERVFFRALYGRKR